MFRDKFGNPKSHKIVDGHRDTCDVCLAGVNDSLLAAVASGPASGFLTVQFDSHVVNVCVDPDEPGDEPKLCCVLCF